MQPHKQPFHNLHNLLSTPERVERINKEYDHDYEDFLFVKDDKCLSPDAVDAQIKRTENPDKSTLSAL